MARTIYTELPHWRLLTLSRELDLFRRGSYVISGRLGRVEHVVHEAGHAVSLGLPLESHVGSEPLELAIGRAVHLQPRSGEDNEALVLAAELHVLPRLGIRRPDLQEQLHKAGLRQGVRGECLRKARRSKAARVLAEEIIEALGARLQRMR